MNSCYCEQESKAYVVFYLSPHLLNKHRSSWVQHYGCMSIGKDWWMNNLRPDGVLYTREIHAASIVDVNNLIEFEDNPTRNPPKHKLRELKGGELVEINSCRVQSFNIEDARARIRARLEERLKQNVNQSGSGQGISTENA